MFDINYQPDAMTVDELRAGFYRLVKRLYNEEQTQRRRERFKEKYLRPHKQEQSP